MSNRSLTKARNINNKCLLCCHYSNENGIDECKSWECTTQTGIAPDLAGCSGFEYREEVTEYIVTVADSNKKYRFTDIKQLEAFITWRALSGIRCSIDQIVRIVNRN